MVDRELLRQSWRAWLSGEERRAGPWWANSVWTALFAALCAVGFTIVSAAANSQNASSPAAWWRWFQANLLVSLIITVTIRTLFAVSSRVIGRERLSGWSARHRSLYFALVPIIGVALAWPPAMLWVLGVDVRRVLAPEHPGSVIASVGLAVLVTAIFIQFFSAKARQIAAENRAGEAQLRLLQAQMQPHFLFNTLANVVSLMESDTRRAKEMLESFVDYLRASLIGLGRQTHTVGDEINLVDAYLRIIQIRMEDRLRYRIDVPAALRTRSLLPLTLQPLVENAVVHGLEPRIEGGTIRIEVGGDDRSLFLMVEDDGAGPASRVGLPAGRGAGTALANIRERLRHAYGPAASLRVEATRPHGTRASLVVPTGS